MLKADGTPGTAVLIHLDFTSLSQKAYVEVLSPNVYTFCDGSDMYPNVRSTDLIPTPSIAMEVRE
jgi:hypothetical protein